MNPIFRRIKQAYKRSGPRGILLLSIKHILRRGATLLLHFANGISTDIPLSTVKKELLVRNQVFKDRHKQRRCFVIGNGPSLKTQDLSPLSHEITFVMSGFWKHPVVEKWQPTYCCFADPLFFDSSKPMEEFFKSLKSKISSSIFFIPLFGKEITEKQSLPPLKKVYYVLFKDSLSKGFRGEIDLTRSVPGVQSVSQLAIELALYMGCNPIYLLGLDHDWLAHRGMDRHFYETKTVENHPEAHGDLDRISYKSDLEDVLRLWCGYEVILKIASRRNVHIVNATNGGFLDVFERMKYESILSTLQ